MPEFCLRFDDVGTAVVLDDDGTQFASRHMATARRHAEKIAAETDTPILICTLDADENPRPRSRVMPDGSRTIPPGMNPPPGPEHAPNDNGVCFCLNCRAARR